MDDLSRKLSELLSDPETLDRIKGLTGLSSREQDAAQSEDSPSAAEAPASGGTVPDAAMLGAFMKLAPMLQSANRENDSTRLLRALKPFLHNDRAKRVDSAIRLLSIMQVLPMLKSSGLALF